jgi:hypothetical protein
MSTNGAVRGPSNRQHLTVCESTHDAVRHDAHEKVERTVLLCGLGIGGNSRPINVCWVNVHAAARFYDIDDNHADNKRDCRCHFEIQDRFDTYASRFVKVVHARNANDY